MSTEPPPTLVGQPAASTPSEDWAASTTNALDAKLESSGATGGAPTTTTDSGPAVPASGLPHESHLATSADVATASEHDKPHIKSLPSQEILGFQPHEHVEGAGELPGTVFERGVARLPEEQKHGHYTGSEAVEAANVVTASEHDIRHLKSFPSQEILGFQPHEHVEGAGELPGTVFESGVARLPEERIHGGYTGSEALTSAHVATASEHDRPHIESLPSEELTGFQPHEHVDGAGELPGTVFEHGVARTPEERRHGSHPGSEALTGANVAIASEHDRPHIKSLPSQELVGFQPHEHVDGAGELPGTVYESGVARLPDERTPGTQTPATGGVPVAATTANDPPTQDKGDVKPKEVAKEQAGSSDKGADNSGTAKTSQALNAPSATNGHSAEQPSPVESKSGHKPGFLERVRGEAKILVGKLAGDRHKVEEGKHTKAGDA